MKFFQTFSPKLFYVCVDNGVDFYPLFKRYIVLLDGERSIGEHVMITLIRFSILNCILICLYVSTYFF